MDVTWGTLPKLSYSRPSSTDMDNRVIDGREKPRCWDWAMLAGCERILLIWLCVFMPSECTARAVRASPYLRVKCRVSLLDYSHRSCYTGPRSQSRVLRSHC